MDLSELDVRQLHVAENSHLDVRHMDVNISRPIDVTQIDVRKLNISVPRRA